MMSLMICGFLGISLQYTITAHQFYRLVVVARKGLVVVDTETDTKSVLNFISGRICFKT